MKLIIKYLPLLFLLFTLLNAQNNHPIVLVHGFGGWGTDEMIGYKYWGGFWDIEEYLEEQGFTVYTVSIGPVSSNWDRAAEVFYQIKGGQLDYGVAHSNKYGLIQKPPGKVYDGFYPEWDTEHPVHLIGHSMGGQTVRMLQYQLEKLFFTDSLSQVPDNSALLGQEHSGWIKSITTISTPNNGTTLVDLRADRLPIFQNFIGLAAMIGSDFYNFDLEHWGFEQKEDESWADYSVRMQNHSAWQSKNISTWDLGLDGARELNGYLRATSNIYYFAYATGVTYRDPITGYHIPGKNVNAYLGIKTKQLGMEIAQFSDGTKTDSTWFENDGVINTISMGAPFTGANGPDLIEIYDAQKPLFPGRWYTFDKIEMDHWASVGHAVFTLKKRKQLLKFYLDHSRLLQSLPE